MKINKISILFIFLSFCEILNAPNQDKDFYLFDDVEQIGLGLIFFNTTKYQPYKFFMLNVKNIKKLYIYVDINFSPFSTLFISQQEKYTFSKNILEYETHSKWAELEPAQYDYLIIYVLSLYKYRGYMNIASELYEINDENSFEILKGSYAMLKVKNDIKNKTYVLVSSNKNIGILGEILSYNSLTDILFLKNITNYIYVYINSTKENSIIKFILEEKTKLNDKENKNNNNNNEKSKGVYALIIIFSIIIFLFGGFLVYRYIKRKKQNDILKDENKEKNKGKLLQEYNS